MKALQTNNVGQAKRIGQISDSEIINRVVQGEKSLFEILMRRYNQSLYRVIRSYLSHEQDVEDVMQDTYLKAYEKLGQFQGISSFATWLIRIGINEALMRLRKNSKQSKSLTGFSNQPSGTSVQMEGNHPEKTFINNEMKLIIERAIDSLPDKYRTIYIMKEIEDMDFEEISYCLDLTHNNASVRFHRAKAMLKEALLSLSSQSDIFTFGNYRCDRIVNKVMILV